MKSVAILQSNYIPWRGYFDMIASVDEFILYDDMQFTKNDWRNRNRIKTPSGPAWISVPVGAAIHRRIKDVELTDHSWQARHWKTLRANYSRAPAFDAVAVWLEPLYLAETHVSLSALNLCFIEAICGFLGIKTRISNSWDYNLGEGKTERLVDLCKQAGATTYVSGPAARDYLDESLFAGENIGVHWFDYAGYPEYRQLWGPFEPQVSILDLLFNCGTQSARFMKKVRS